MARDKRKLCKAAGAVIAMVVIFLTALACLEFAGLKRVMLSVFSDRATATFGQPVDIDDISFKFPAVITVNGITVGNPRGFAPGQVLKIQKIILDMKVEDLFSGKLDFNEIIVDSPTVAIRKDEKGNLNISDSLRRFFSRDSGAGYRIGTVRISSGNLSINADKRMTAKKIDLVLRNLSPGTKSKTDIKGGLTYAGNRIYLQGWAYLRKEGRQFGVSVSARDFSPALFSGDLNYYRIDAKNATLDADVGVEGDTGKRIELKSRVRVRGARVAGFPPAGDITLTSDSFFDISNDTLTIKDLSVRAGEVSKARLKGVITDLKKNPTYTADLMIHKFDLAAVNFLEGVKLAGILTSGDMHAEGRVGTEVPEVSGPVFLSDGSVTSSDFTVKRINASAVLSSRKEFSFKVESAADITVLQKRRFEKPAHLRFSLQGRGGSGRIKISSSAVIVPVEMILGGKILQAAAVHLDSKGVLHDKRFFGRAAVEIRDVTFGGKRTGSFVIRSHADLGKGVVELKEISLKNDHVTGNAKTARLGTSGEKTGYRIEIENLNADYPSESSGITHLKLYLDLKKRKGSLSGFFDLSADRVKYMNLAAGPLEGGGTFDGDTFEADFRRMKLFGGDLKCSLHGGTGKGFFPLRLSMDAEKLDLSDISKTLMKSKFLKLPYDLSEGTGSIFFNGTFNSMANLTGKASFRLVSLSASGRRDGRSLLKGMQLTGEIDFRGNDLEFTADAGVGKVAAHTKGFIRDFTGKEMEGRAEAEVPVVKAADMRDSFWDICPDSLLYAGLDGSLSASLSAEFMTGGVSLDGGIMLKDVVLTGENDEFSVGPVNGTIPVTYRSAGKSEGIGLPTFDKDHFSALRKYYETWGPGEGFNIVTAGSFSYGFRLLNNIKVMVKPENGFLNIGKVSANIFGGALEGAAEIGFSEGLKYRAGFLIDGLSLRKLCDNIAPVRGYISGKVGGIADIKSSGGGLAGLIGRADFWTYESEDEKTMISKEFLRNVGGPAVKTYLGDRRFDKGIMDLYIQKGFLIFKDLEISHRNFLGMRDLSIKVAPFNNRIRIGDLLWSITEAAQRARKD